MKEPVAGYIRVSTLDQKLRGLSLPAQRMKLEEYAEKHGLIIVEFYCDEGVSGQKPIAKRPELQRMIADSKKGKFKRIIFIKLDRFSRSVGKYYKCMDMLDNMPWTATEEEYDTTTANGIAFLNMKLTIAQLEAQQTGERIKLIHEYKAKAGIPMMGTYSLPFCYENPAGQEGQRKLYKRNEEAMMAAIEYVEQHHSIRGAMKLLNNEYGLNISYRSTATALRNPLICGRYRDNENYCEPYISKERFEQLQKIMERNKRGETKYDYIFQGLIICPECGRKLNGSQHNCTSKGYSYRYSAYRCPSHRMDNMCSFSSCVFENKMESLLIEYIQLQTLSEYDSGEPKPTKIKIDIEPLKAELGRVQKSWEKGRLTEDEYDKRYDELSAKIKEAEQYNSKIDTDVPELKPELYGEWIEAYAKLDNKSKSDFWHSFIQKIEISWGKSEKKITNVIFY